ncbi:MerR family transcriptional regulator [Sphingomonas sp. Leaf231]|uniref:MerR family transcriptional regulator n=1 Tax=Sphingomonas sp. Leaf231 TaxID=1736301 RepID=UPI0006F753AC|nr:MerR family transcriptional regulator [Sphingomonas sp. Leaf231]KQN92537.1 MerR family transcriptional regulator [Sphingomonas sp. Leaf231]
MASDSKSAAAFRTIGEVASTTGLAPHILRYWESRFPQLRPITRAGNRRYYRPDDVALIERIDRLLNREGYTIRGVQQLLARDTATPSSSGAPPLQAAPAVPAATSLIAIRKLLADAIDADLT